MPNSNLQFDFLVNKENNTITVVREFAAPRPLVWDCYTKSELLDQWFAPKPWKTRTQNMDFTEGGHWLYAMCGPEGEEHWGRMDYVTIQPKDSFSAWDGFCDQEGKLNEQLPRAAWRSDFADKSGHTLVTTEVTYNALSDLETVIEMGMIEGLTMAMEGLDTLIDDLKKN